MNDNENTENTEVPEIEIPEKPADDKLRLTPLEVRVLGCLIEKELSTPEYYPLTLNALVAACNQKSNRDPMMTLDDKTVLRTLDDLRYERKLVRQLTTAGSRVPKYRHTVAEEWAFTPQESAVLCELFLRGAQTAGQLRTRTPRLCAFAEVGEVEAVLNALAEHEDGPFVMKLPREPGCREQRWAHLLAGEIDISQAPAESRSEPARIIIQAENERIAALETKVSALRAQVEQLTARFAEFHRQFD